MFSFSLLTPPAIEPVTLAEAKAHARIDTEADDALIATLITSARQWAEHYTNRAFITQTWRLSLDAPPKTDVVLLPRAPLQSVASFQYFDDADAATTFAEAHYFVDTSREPGRLVLRLGATWPSPVRTANGIVITYIAGYGDGADNVPEPLKFAIRELVAHWYEHRGDEAVETPLAAHALLSPYRLRYAGMAL